MSRNNTGNPIGSKAFPDFEDNVKNLDEAVNTADPQWVDRFGRFRLPLMEQERQFVSDQERRDGEFQADQAERAAEFNADQAERAAEFNADQSSREAVFSNFLQASGYQDLGEYAPGIEITAHNQYVTFGGQPYLLKPSIPVPYTTSGGWTGDDFKLIGDGSIRQDLANPGKGSAMVARGVVAVDSIADLSALSSEQVRSDLLYLVSSYHSGWAVRVPYTGPIGGGEFSFVARDMSEEVATDPLGGVYVPPGHDLTGASGAFVRIYSGGVQLPWFGAMPNEAAADVDNEASFLAAIRHGDVLINEKYFIKTGGTHNIDNSFALFGEGMLEFGTSGGSWLSLGDGVSVEYRDIRISRTGTSGLLTLFAPRTDTTLIEKISATRVKFNGSISLFRGTFSTAVDPAVTPYGVKRVSLKYSEATNCLASFFVGMNMPHDKIEIEHNEVRNMGYVFCSVGTAGHAHQTSLNSRMKRLVARYNHVQNDDDLIVPGTSGSYLAFIVYEGSRIDYKDNHVEGLKSLDDIAVYDIYVGDSELHYSGNTWKNNLCLSPTKQNNELLKAKGAKKSYYLNNNFVVEKDFVQRHGADIPGAGWVTFFNKTSASDEAEIRVQHNNFDIYQLLFMSSSGQTKNIYIEDNNFKIGTAAGTFVDIRNNSSDVSDYSDAVVRVRNNVFDIGNVATLKRGASEYSYFRLFDESWAEGKGDYKQILLDDNTINIDQVDGSAALAYRFVSPNTSVKRNAINIGTLNGVFRPLNNTSRGHYGDISDNSFKVASGAVDGNAFLMSLSGDHSSTFGWTYEGTYASWYTPVLVPLLGESGIRVRLELTVGADIYSGTCSLKMTPTGVQYTDMDGAVQSVEYPVSGGTKISPRMLKVNEDDLLIPGISFTVQPLTNSNGGLYVRYNTSAAVSGVSKVKYRARIEVIV